MVSTKLNIALQNAHVSQIRRKTSACNNTVCCRYNVNGVYLIAYIDTPQKLICTRSLGAQSDVAGVTAEAESDGRQESRKVIKSLGCQSTF